MCVRLCCIDVDVSAGDTDSMTRWIAANDGPIRNRVPLGSFQLEEKKENNTGDLIKNIGRVAVLTGRCLRHRHPRLGSSIRRRPEEAAHSRPPPPTAETAAPRDPLPQGQLLLLCSFIFISIFISFQSCKNHSFIFYLSLDKETLFSCGV